MSDSIFDNGILYSRPKQSDIMQGIVDGAKMLQLELDKLHRFYGYTTNTSFSGVESAIQYLNNQCYNCDGEILDLRKRGL